MVHLKIGSKSIPFLVDTGATHSVLTQPLSQPSLYTINIQGATGKTLQRPFLEPLVCSTGGNTITHQFVYMPDCPIPLLGRDLLCKLRAQITFEENGTMEMQYGHVKMEVPQEEAWRMMMVQETGKMLSGRSLIFPSCGLKTILRGLQVTTPPPHYS